jgi:uncharacterized protein with PIN domain
MDDKDLIELSKAEDRILLTRDKELAAKKDLNVVYVESDRLEAQMKQIIDQFDLEFSARAFSRCPECNNILTKHQKDEVIEKVPKGVLANQKQFWYCKNCNQYFWQGTHFEKIKTKLIELTDKDLTK